MARADNSDDAPLTLSQMRRLHALLQLLLTCMHNKERFRWGEGCRVQWTRLLASAGVHLMTKTALAKQGLEPKRGCSPVGTGYFGAPLKVHAELFIKGIQTRPAAGGRAPLSKTYGEASARPTPRRGGPHVS